MATVESSSTNQGGEAWKVPGGFPVWEVGQAEEVPDSLEWGEGAVGAQCSGNPK